MDGREMIRRLLELAERAPGGGAMAELRELAAGMLRPDFTGLTPAQRKVAQAMLDHWLTVGAWPTQSEVARRVYGNRWTKAVAYHQRTLVRLGVAVSDAPSFEVKLARCVRLVFRG
jgi:hypothetical protein